MTNRTVNAVSSLPRSTPAEQGVDPAAVGRLLDALDRAGLELHSLMVLRHGQVVAEGWWDPYPRGGLHLLYSLSKSFTSTAVGLAVEEGLLGLDDLVTSFFPDQTPDQPSPLVARMKVRHLLSMATGHHEDTLDRLDRRRLVASFLALAPEEEPGTWFTYNNGATMMLSAILTELTGGRLLDFLRPRLLEPLGITEANWQGFDDLDLGFSGLHLPTEAIAKFGQLYLQRGVWQGRQLVPEQWVVEATREQVENPREPNPDWRQGYGFQFWMARHGYRGDGAFGQFCLVLPEQDAVVAMTSATEDMQAVLDCVWAELLPALSGVGAVQDEARQDGAGQDGADADREALVERLSRLRLPVAAGDRTGADVRLPWTAPDEDPAAPEEPAEGLRCSVERIEETPAGWRLQLRDGLTSYAVDCGYDEWVSSEVEAQPGFRLSVAASGAWTGSTFTVELALIETPHRLQLSWDGRTGETAARWHVAPLGASSPSGLALELARA